MPLKKTLRDMADDVRRRGEVRELDAEQLTQWRDSHDKPIVIDVREPHERAEGHIPESVAVPRGVLERDIEKTVFDGSVDESDLDRPIVTYCGGGSRSLLAAEQLARMGFTQVYSLAGGFRGWNKAEKPVATED